MAQLTSLTLPADMTDLQSLELDGNPLDTLVLSDPLAATNLAENVASLRNENVSVFTFPLNLHLIAPRETEDGVFQFAVTGPPGVYIVFSSVDLLTWSELTALTNNLGTTRLTDPASPLSPHEFYRAQSVPRNQTCQNAFPGRGRSTSAGSGALLSGCKTGQLGFVSEWPLVCWRSIKPSKPSTMPVLPLAPLTATSGTMRTLRSPTICMSCITV